MSSATAIRTTCDERPDKRQARKVSADLLESGALRSDSTRKPLILNFSPRLSGDWMPGLFPG